MYNVYYVSLPTYHGAGFGRHGRNDELKFLVKRIFFYQLYYINTTLLHTCFVFL